MQQDRLRGFKQMFCLSSTAVWVPEALRRSRKYKRTILASEGQLREAKERNSHFIVALMQMREEREGQTWNRETHTQQNPPLGQREAKGQVGEKKRKRFSSGRSRGLNSDKKTGKTKETARRCRWMGPAEEMVRWGRGKESLIRGWKQR